MLIVIRAGLNDLVWTVVAGEHSMTGMREAVITAELMNAGALTIESYQQSWSQDPYKPDYTGVDRSVLRFMSDDKKYDERFPTHPLSKVRSVLSSLPNHLRVTGNDQRAIPAKTPVL
jgi:hypothetical protein